MAEPVAAAEPVAVAAEEGARVAAVRRRNPLETLDEFRERRRLETEPGQHVPIMDEIHALVLRNVDRTGPKVKRFSRGLRDPHPDTNFRCMYDRHTQPTTPDGQRLILLGDKIDEQAATEEWGWIGVEINPQFEIVAYDTHVNYADHGIDPTTHNIHVSSAPNKVRTKDVMNIKDPRGLLTRVFAFSKETRRN